MRNGLTDEDSPRDRHTTEGICSSTYSWMARKTQIMSFFSNIKT